jgi:hypothetical protein
MFECPVFLSVIKPFLGEKLLLIGWACLQKVFIPLIPHFVVLPEFKKDLIF